MAKKPQAGELYYSVAFEKSGTAPDGYGGTLTAWTEQFACRAAFTHLRGGEAVQAARLENRHPQVISVRKSIQAGQVTAEWRIRDKRTGEVFAIKDIEPHTDRAFISFLCERGTAQ